jgi:hypothetical protein
MSEQPLPECRPGASWEELSRLRWGPAVGDPTPGIVIDVPDRQKLMRALKATLRPSKPDVR